MRLKKHLNLSAPDIQPREPRSATRLDDMSLGRSWDLLLVILILVVTLFPFANRAFHIDDPFYVWVAQHIANDPLDFYGFTLNWNGFEEPVHEINKNPPGISFYLAAAGMLLGWDESNFHTAFMLLTIATAVGLYLLAERLTKHALLVVLAVIFSPVYILSAINIMSEMGMLMFYVWALYFWIRGIKEDRSAYLILSGVLIGLSALTKYYGLSAIPLVLAYGLAEKRHIGKWTFSILVPVSMLALYEFYTTQRYGSGHIVDAILFAENSGLRTLPMYLRLPIGLAFLGGCTFPVALYSFFLWSRWYLCAMVGGVLASTAVLKTYLLHSFFTLKPELDGGELWYAFQFAILIWAGIHLGLLAVRDLYLRRDTVSILLFLWLLGTFIFAIRFNWAINGRSLLAAALPASLYLARTWEFSVPTSGRFHWRLTAPLVPAACLAIAVAYADFTQANVFRTAARSLGDNFGGPGHTLWYQGHWGFQYYMDQVGGKHTETTGISVSKGDYLVTPYYITAAYQLDRSIVDEAWELEIQPFQWLTTWNPKKGAGYYAEPWGPMPFIITRVPPERFTIVKIVYTGRIQLGGDESPATTSPSR